MMSPTHVRCLVSKTPPLLALELTQRYFLCHRLTVWRMTNARTRSSHTVLICSALPAPRNGQAMRILPFATSILTKRKGSKMRGPPVRRQPPQHGGGLGLSVGPEHLQPARGQWTPGLGSWSGDQRLPPHTGQWWICVDRCSWRWQWRGVAVVWWDTVGIHQLGWRATNRRKPRFSSFDKVNQEVGWLWCKRNAIHLSILPRLEIEIQIGWVNLM